MVDISDMSFNDTTCIPLRYNLHEQKGDDWTFENAFKISDKELDGMVQAVGFSNEQLAVLLKGLRNQPRRSSIDMREPSKRLKHDSQRSMIKLLLTIEAAGQNGIRACKLEDMLCNRKRAKGRKVIIEDRSKLHHWLSKLVSIGVIRKDLRVEASTRPNPNKRKPNVYYSTNDAFNYSGLIRFSIEEQRLEDQVAHMPACITQLADVYEINVPELAVMACRRLHIAKDLLLEKAGILVPDEEIDRIYRHYYNEESPIRNAFSSASQFRVH